MTVIRSKSKEGKIPFNFVHIVRMIAVTQVNSDRKVLTSTCVKPIENHVISMKKLSVEAIDSTITESGTTALANMQGPMAFSSVFQ